VSVFEKIFGDSAQVKLVNFILSKPDKPFNLSELARETGLSHSSVSRVILPLIKLKIVSELKIGSRMRIFYLNTKSELTKTLKKFMEELSKIIVEKS